MLALSIESATNSAAVALVDERRVLAERFLNIEKNHSEKLLPQIDGLLADSDISCEALDLIAVSIGPGSFTGLRIGLSTAKGLAYGWDLPIQGVNTLDAMAHVLAGDAGCVVPLVNARRAEAYCGFYRGGERIGDYEVLRADGIRAALTERGLSDPVFIGDGVHAIRDDLQAAMPDARFASPCLLDNRASGVGQLALFRFGMSGPDDLDGLRPAYVRASQAQQRFGRKSADE